MTHQRRLYWLLPAGLLLLMGPTVLLAQASQQPRHLAGLFISSLGSFSDFGGQSLVGSPQDQPWLQTKTYRLPTPPAFAWTAVRWGASFARSTGMPSALMLPPTSQTVCANSPTTAIALPPSVRWTNTSPSIGLAPTGSGTIPSFTAHNAGSTPIVAAISTIAQQTLTFAYTGTMQTWMVPDGVTSVTVSAYGAQGGDGDFFGNFSPAPGGLGGWASGQLAVQPGQVLHVVVGGAGSYGYGAAPQGGGYNGGGDAYSNNAYRYQSGGGIEPGSFPPVPTPYVDNYRGGGGGASDIRVGGTALGDRVLVAGGGGGGSYGGRGGAGGGLTGEPPVGFDFPASPGTQTAGGANVFGFPGTSASLGQGGSIDAPYTLAGGGGGYYGGGAGNSAAGGSSYLGGVTSGTTTAGLQPGNGQIIISYVQTITATLQVNPPPAAPALATASGHPYPAGVTSLTISQNVGPIQLVASGCSGELLLANNQAGSDLAIPTAIPGPQTYTASCTQNGCTSPAGSFQLTVVPTTLSVLHRDADYGQLTNNIIKPYLELANAGGQAVPYGEVTVRYWFTSEGNAPPTNLAVYYAQLGTVNMNYVALSQPRQGAYGYVEYSFPGGGNLAGGGNSGPIENGIQKTDGSNFDERDDYSYQANYQDYISNVHITAYRNGTIVWGQEPTSVASQTAVQVYSQARDQVSTSQIQTRLELRNTGNVALPVANLKLRYYFTSDNGQLANVYVDYADIGATNVAAQVVKLGTPVGGADSYVELTFPGNPMQLNALSSLGAIDFRLVRSDYGLFDQSNDYSYMANYGNVGLNTTTTAYLGTTRLFGTPPAAGLRAMSLEPTAVLQARLLGNPVVGSRAEVEIRGAASQVVNLRLVDLQGRTIHEQRIEQAAETERISVPLGTSRGTLLLRVTTETQQQRLKLLRP